MIEFRPETHEYLLDGQPLISVTQLMRKHGLAPDYGAVTEAVLAAKAERGTLIHQEIEEYLKKGELGFTTELGNFIQYIDLNGIKVLASETVLHNDIVAGTADLILDGGIVADIKTTASLHKDAVSWQLSIYAELYNATHPTTPVTKGQAFHFNAEGELRVVDIPLKPQGEILRLLECERNGQPFTQALTVSQTALAELAYIEGLIKGIEEQKKAAEAQAQELRAAILEAMEQNGISCFENESIRLTYVAPTTRTSIDGARLKKEMPEIAAAFTKTSTVKASLRITLKEGQ